MKSVYKYPISDTTDTAVVPMNAEVLCVQMQYDKPTVWALVDLENISNLEKVVAIYGTGHKINTDRHEHKYIGTFQMMGGSLVFHAFELIPRSNEQ